MPTVFLRISILYNLLNSFLLYFFPQKLRNFLPPSWLSISHQSKFLALEKNPSSPSTSSSSTSSSSSSSFPCSITTTTIATTNSDSSPASLSPATSLPLIHSDMDPAELKRVFQMFDRNGDGRITKKELSDSLENLGIFIPDKDLIQMIEKIDVNGDGCVDIDEFGALYQTIMNERDEEEDMREAFNVFDQNGDGFITVEELRSVLSSLGLKQGRTVEDCRRMIRKVDVDGDGMVNFKEFKQMMRGGGFAALS